jgi:hypothetical protein
MSRRSTTITTIDPFIKYHQALHEKYLIQNDLHAVYKALVVEQRKILNSQQNELEDHENLIRLMGLTHTVEETANLTQFMGFTHPVEKTALHTQETQAKKSPYINVLFTISHFPPFIFVIISMYSETFLGEDCSSLHQYLLVLAVYLSGTMVVMLIYGVKNI